MASGRIYVPVDANTANGIMTMDSSMQTGGSFWLNWTNEGYTGISWFWDDQDNYLAQGWKAAVDSSGGFINGCPGNADGTGHTASQSDFLYHISQGHASDLNSILGAWNNDDKVNFVLKHAVEFYNTGCVTSA